MTPPPLPINLPKDRSITPYLLRSAKEVRRDASLGPGSEQFDALIHAYLPLVYGTAQKLVPEQPVSALRISKSAFELLAIRWQSVLKGGENVIAQIVSFLLHATVSASLSERKLLQLKKSARDSNAAAHLLLFKHFFRLSKKFQRSLLVTNILQIPAGDAAQNAVTGKIASKGLQKLQGKLRKTPPGSGVAPALANLSAPAPDEAVAEVIESLRRWSLTAPRADLTRSTMVAWRLAAWGRFFKRAFTIAGASVAVFAIIAFTAVLLFKQGFFNDFLLTMGQKDMLKKFPEMGEPATPWPVTDEDRAHVQSELPRSSADLYASTNIWLAKLSFTRDAWKDIQPDRVKPVPNLFDGGRLQLRNPHAQRSGLAGALGLDFNFVNAQLEFAGARFTNVAARYRGNGTFVNSRYGPKQSFKVDLNKYTKKQAVGGIDELNFVNSIPDFSYLHDAMAQQLLRDIGVLAPRTAYAYLSIDVHGKWTNQPIGLYVLIENIDKDFAEDRFGTKKTPIFKPVTYELFHDLGSEWTNYADIYDLKTDATPEQLQRIIDFSQLVSHASDEEYARRLPEFLDVEQFAAYVAGNALLASYDGFFFNGQNFYIYLHPETGKISFISWDQDHSWGEFGYVGRAEEREQASIWKPWVRNYDFRFLKRTMEVPAFREAYQRKLEGALEKHFTKENLYPQIDQLAATIRPAVAAESSFRLKRFELAVGSEWFEGERDGPHEGPLSPPHQIKRFIEARIESVKAQLAGESEGVQLSPRF